MWSRQGNDLTNRFPDVAAAAVRQLPAGVVLDGELVILIDGRLSFDALQQRLVTGARNAGRLVAAAPASYAAFDLLAIGGIDLRTQRWTVRRGRLEQLAARWAPPLQLSPVTADVEEAREWFDVLPAAMGIEGLVVKGASSRYVRIVQLTPPGSGCSIQVGRGVTSMPPGSLEGLQLVVPDLPAAHAELADRGVPVSGIQVYDRDGLRPREEGEELDNVGFVHFADPDGNRWIVQQISSRAL